MGFCTQFTEARLDNTFHYIGVRFFPAMFPHFFHIKASELSNRMGNLSDVAPTTSRYISECFSPLLEMPELRSLLDQHFLKLLYNTRIRYDGRLYEAIHCMLGNAGNLNVQRDLKAGISPRQLRRIFEFYIGDTPKAFCKVVRFQHIL